MFICTVQYLWQFTCTLYDNMYTMHTVNTVIRERGGRGGGERGGRERGGGERGGRGGSDKRERRGREGRERERRKGYMYTQKITQTPRH